MILLSANTGREVCPGNLYLVNLSTQEKEFKQDVPSIDWRRLEADTLFRKKRDPSLWWPVLLEFSAPCDFAQAKMKLPRFVAGYLVHDSIFDQVMQQAAFIRVLGPVLLSQSKPKIEGIFWLVLNSHFVTSATTESATKWACLARVRSEALVDITAWATAHMARPGYVHLDG